MKLVFSIALIIFYKSSFAQIDIVSKSVSHPDSNVLYIGVENYLRVKGISISNCNLVIEGSKISKLGNDFIVIVSNPGNVLLKLYSNKKLALSKSFRIETIPPMKAQLGGIVASVAKISEILTNPFLHVVIPNSAYKHDFSILSFELDIIAANDTISKGGSTNNTLSKTQLSILKELRTNDKLSFHNIRGVCPYCAVRKFPDFSITIK